MQLTREAIQRMIDGQGSGGSGGGGISASDIAGLLAGYATEDWVNENYLSIAFFSKLFKAYNGSTLVEPNDTDSTINNIKAMFGFWTEQYISSLGQNSGGGGGGATSLSDLVDVALSNPANGQALIYNSSLQKWVNGAVTTGTVTSVKTGTGLTGGEITTTGTISINSTYQSYISHGETAYGYFDANGNAKSALKLTTVSKTAWGKTYWNANGIPQDVSGSIDAGNSGGGINGFQSIDLNTHDTAGSGYGGWLDFHYDGTANDYSLRLIEDARGVLKVQARSSGNEEMLAAIQVGGNQQHASYVQIGYARLVWDNTNNALKVVKSDGTAVNLYVTGGVAALAQT